MRSKAPLSLMEQMVMILVFALAAALCLQAFVKSDAISKGDEARDRGAVLCQSAAEAVRSAGGDFGRAAQLLSTEMWQEDSLTVFYDADWQPGAAAADYTLKACRLETDVPGLEKAGVWLQEDGTGEELFRLEVAWQVPVSQAGDHALAGEVSGNG